MLQSESPASAKAALRAEKLALRDEIHENYRTQASYVVAARGKFFEAHIVGGYWPMRSEFDPRPLMQVMAGAGARLALPVTTNNTLTFRSWHEGDPLQPAGFGTSVPLAPAAVVEPDLLLVPLAVFDRRCYRIGYGRAYYDTAIAEMTAAGRRPRLIGLGFNLQEVEEVPIEPHDERLDMVLTESQIIARRVWE